MTDLRDIVEAVQTKLQSLPVSATLGEKAAAIAAMGHPTWFGLQSGFSTSPMLARGSTRPIVPEFTTDIGRLSGQTASSDANTIMFDIKGRRGGVSRFSIDVSSGAVIPWRTVTKVSLQHAVAAAAPVSKQAAELVEKQPYVALSIADAETNLEAALWAVEAAEAAAGSVTVRVQQLKSSLAKDREALRKLEGAMALRLTEVVLAGGDVGDSQPEAAKIRKLRLKIDATERAIPLAANGHEACSLALQGARQDLIAATLDRTAAHHLAAITSVRQEFAALAPALARLVAIDAERERVLGSEFSAADVNHPGLRAPGRMVRRLLRELPPLFTPAELNPSAFEATVSSAITTTSTETVEVHND